MRHMVNIFAIFFSAILAFLIGAFYHQPLHWYLFILIICIGLFIQVVLIIVRAPDEQE